MGQHFLQCGNVSLPWPSCLKVSETITYKNDHSTSCFTGLLQDIGPCIPILPLTRKILVIILKEINVASFTYLWPTLRKKEICAIILWCTGAKDFIV